MICEEIDRHLDAYVDGELDPATGEAVRAHVESCAECRRRIAGRQALGRLVQAAPYYSAPASLRARVTAQSTRRRSARRFVAWAAAAAVIIAAGGGLAWRRSASVRADAMVEAIVDGHVRSLMAGHLSDVESTDQHTVKPWFLGKLDFSPPVTDLAADGFPLRGGRLDYLEGHPVAALVYARRQHTINVFVAPARDDAFPDLGTRTLRGFHVHHWTAGGMAFWAVSDLNDDELTEFVGKLKG